MVRGERVFVVMCVIGMVACSGRKGSWGEKSSCSDTTCIESTCVTTSCADTEGTMALTCGIEMLAPLPDTIYPSAALIKYKVDIFGDTADGFISSLADMYSDTPGAFTFRKGSTRRADFGGRVHGHPTDIEVDWTFKTDFSGTWGGGTGWTGQPLYVQWPDSSLAVFRAKHLVNDGFSGREVMFGSLCGKVYFVDFDTGTPSRDAIDVGNPVKGTMSLDPTLNGNLYVGHGVPDTIPFGALVIDLYSNKVAEIFDRDPNAWRGWGAYDSSPLRLGQFLFRPGENGTLYKFLVRPGSLKLQSTLRYMVNGSAPGIESSMSIYRDYGYISDNHGNIICVNLTTMKPVWLYRLGDDIDSSMILLEEEGVPYVYTGCEIDKQGVGDAKYVKLNGINGDKVWELKIPGQQYIAPDEKHFDGGFYSTALPGIGNCDSLMFVNCVINEEDQQNGNLLAINRQNGKIKYAVPTKKYSWSSPVGFLNEDNDMYVVTGDAWGNIYLIDGIDGDIITTKRIGYNFESSPVVTGNHLVVGTRGRAVYKMTVK